MNLIAGLQLLSRKYGLRDCDVYAEHDEIVLDVITSDLESGDWLELEKLGFNINFEEGMVKFYV